MARLWTLQWEEPEFLTLASGGGSRSVEPTTGRPVMDLDASTDESFVVAGIMPAETTTATFKARVVALAEYDGSGAATDRDARISITGECITPDNAEDATTDSFSSADSGSITFAAAAGVAESITITLSNFETGKFPTAGDLFRLKITRDADGTTGTDDLAVDLRVMSVEFWEET